MLDGTYSCLPSVERHEVEAAYDSVAVIPSLLYVEEYYPMEPSLQ